MSFQEKNVVVSLVSVTLILGYFSLRILRMLQTETFIATNVFRLWFTIIIVSIVVNILGTIITQIVSAIIHYIRTNEEETHVEDERDKLIELKGTNVAFIVFSGGVLLAMLSFVLGQPPLVMFSLLIASGLLAQVVGDISRLYRYRRGF